MANNIKITVIGDGIVGKTCLLNTYITKVFPEDYIATVFEHHSEEITVDDITYNVTLTDTAGQENYEKLRPLSYPNTDCFLICFSVDQDLASYEHVVVKWVPEARHYKPLTPIVLVATKIDLRDNPSIKCYTYKDGKRLKNKVKANAYVECSAKNMEGLDEVFIEAIRLIRKSRTKSQYRNCVIL